jgi:hypothetical protein
MEAILIKFGEKEHMERLLTLGEVYTRPLKVFREGVNELPRYDKREGLRPVRHLNEKSKIYIKPLDGDKWLRLPLQKGLAEEWTDTSRVHNYSMFALTDDEIDAQPDFVVPQEMKQFGEYMVVIRNPPEFRNRLGFALQKTKLNWAASRVDYYDSNENQTGLTFWHKSIEHSFSKEIQGYI